jgi:hypothetical protein
MRPPPPAAGFFAWLAAPLPPPVLLADADAGVRDATACTANIWPLETPMRHAQMEALLRRASLKRLDAEHQAVRAAGNGPTGISPAVVQLRPDRTGRRVRHHRAGAGRIRHRQGSGRARRTLAAAPRRPVRGDQLRRHSGRPAGKRTVRPREGRLHRRADPRKGRSKWPRAAPCCSTKSAT